MGSKTPIKKLRGNSFKCDICSRSLLSRAALESHQQCVHSAAMRARSRSYKPATPVTPAPKPKPQLKSASSAKIVKTPATKSTRSSRSLTAEKVETKVVEKKDEVIVEKSIKPKTTVTSPVKCIDERLKTVRQLMRDKFLTKAMFQCPILKCNKLYPVYFQAQRHIQKSHRHNVSVTDGSPTSAQLPIPIEVDICIKCNKAVSENTHHSCKTKAQDGPLNLDIGAASMYNCLSCGAAHSSMNTYDQHVRGMHGDNVESFFFPKETDFFNWKESIEKQTWCTYNLQGEYNNKLMFRCSHFTTHFENNNQFVPELVANFCPSMMIGQIFDKGTQVHFYPTHSDHKVGEYVHLEQYTKNKISKFNDSTICTTPKLMTTQLVQLKSILDNLIRMAASTSAETLDTLIEMANEMTSVLSKENSASQNNSLNKTKKVLTDNQISNALNTSASKKRKPEMETNLLVPEKIVKKTALNNGESPKPLIIKKLEQSPSFNDSYREFVEKNLVTDDKMQMELVQRKVPRILQKRQKLKTKIGQFKPSLSPKKRIELKESEIKVEAIKYEVVEQDDDCNILVLKI